LPNGNGIAVLRKRFEFANVEALEGFLADLSDEEKSRSVLIPFKFQLFTWPFRVPVRLPIGRDHYDLLVRPKADRSKTFEEPNG